LTASDGDNDSKYHKQDGWWLADTQGHNCHNLSYDGLSIEPITLDLKLKPSMEGEFRQQLISLVLYHIDSLLAHGRSLFRLWDTRVLANTAFRHHTGPNPILFLLHLVLVSPCTCSIDASLPCSGF
jgi:hypothetical protein